MVLKFFFVFNFSCLKSAMFEEFENGNYISQENLKLIENFICGNLNGWSPNKSYYYTQLNYFKKLWEVCACRKKQDFRPIGKKGEAICNNELVNFFADEKQKLLMCICFLKYILHIIISYMYS